MPIYEYNALNIKGKNKTDIIDADSVAAARQKLRALNIYPISIQEVHEQVSVSQDRPAFLDRPFLSRIKPMEVAMMTRQLSTLLGAGFPLVSALATLIPQTPSPRFKRVLSRIKDAIEEGSGFSAALAQYPEIFSPIYINMVGSGESSGTLELVLQRLADISERQQELSHRIRSAMAYPILMSVVGMLILFFLLTYIVPTMTSIFSDMGQQLPAPTRILIGASNFLRTWWWLLLSGLALGGYGFHRFRKTANGKYWLDKCILSIPVAGNLSRKLAVSRFSRTLGTLLENGVSLLPSLYIVRNVVGNQLIADMIEHAAEEVEKGNSLGKSLDRPPYLFPNISIQMIQVGEQSGEIETMLNKVADMFENEIEAAVTGLTALLEPVIILVMGVIVAFIVLSICLPIFEMNELIK